MASELIKVAVPHVQNYLTDIITNPLKIIAGVGYVLGFIHSGISFDALFSPSALASKKLADFPDLVTQFTEEDEKASDKVKKMIATI